MTISKKELKILQLENRIKHMESRGNTPADCGAMRKAIRQLRNLKIGG